MLNMHFMAIVRPHPNPPPSRGRELRGPQKVTSPFGDVVWNIINKHSPTPGGRGLGGAELLHFIKNSLLLTALVLFLISPAISSASDKTRNIPSDEAAYYLLAGKSSLAAGDYKGAIAYLTVAYNRLPLLGDYALLWRAMAFKNKGEINRAISDLRSIRDKYGDFPLVRDAKRLEIELLIEKNSMDAVELFEAFVRDYPSEFEIKYAYALFLKRNDETKKATDVFREIFRSTSPLSKDALNKLLPSDIAIEDLIKRGNNHNRARMFRESKKAFEEALKRDDSGEFRNEIIGGLALSLFRQRYYRDAAELYRELNNYSWWTRSLFRLAIRAGDMEIFEAELPALIKAGDEGVVPVLIAHGLRKKRAGGDIEGAIKIFNMVISEFPSKKRGALWAKGWTYFLSRNHKDAYEIFSKLYKRYGSTRYLYWKNRCAEILGRQELPMTYRLTGSPDHDFYVFMSMLRNNQKIPGIEEIAYQPVALLPSSLPSVERVDILSALGFKREAISELIHLSGKDPSRSELIYLSSRLRKLGNYRMAIRLISRVPRGERPHKILFPMAFLPEIEEASKKKEIDPLLILAVIRQESKFDPNARSVAGARGLMQLMPKTAQRVSGYIGKEIASIDDLYDVRTNILLGTYYLRNRLDIFNYIPIALAAYNAGASNVKIWVERGNYTAIDEFIENIPFRETRNYVIRVLTNHFEYMRASGDIDVAAIKRYKGHF
ncbi:lytic transglycosylase domain-containing protein [Thermodesulfovibrionales bacterium]|nr:lytic transglycosylase domain-containing protein [Thermodesulfovibrionales bacterium]